MSAHEAWPGVTAERRRSELTHASTNKRLYASLSVLCAVVLNRASTRMRASPRVLPAASCSPDCYRPIRNGDVTAAQAHLRDTQGRQVVQQFTEAA